MLENSILIDGTKGQELDKLFKEYNDLVIKLKDLNKTKGEIVEKIKEVCNKGETYETMNYTITMVQKSGAVTVDRKALEEKYPTVFEEVKKVGEPTLSMGTPKLKGNRS